MKLKHYPTGCFVSRLVRGFSKMKQINGKRISDLSCDKAAFEKAAPEYNQALQRSGFKHTILYKP